MRHVDPCRAGPHPDLRAELVVRLDENAHQVPELATPGLGPAQAADLRVLQQRTLFGVPWLLAAPHTAPSLVSVDVAVGLVVWEPPGGRRQLVQYQAYRHRHTATETSIPADWGIARTGQEWLDSPSARPWSGCFDVAQGLGICVGLVRHTAEADAEIGGLRLTLPGGQTFVSLLADGSDSTLLFVPFHRADLWAGRAQLAWLDRQGQPLSVSDYALSPEPPPPAV